MRHGKKAHLQSDTHGIRFGLSNFPSDVEFENKIKVALLFVLATEMSGLMIPHTISKSPFGWKDRRGADTMGVERKMR